MGSQSGWEQPNGFHPNGLLPNAAPSVTRVLDPERWARAEERTAHLLSCIQPDWPSERHRNAVASYLQDLISKCISCQVFTFGSVPLKTYLPDGDIDLTAFGKNQNLKDNWAIEVRNMLEREEKNERAEFQVKEVQYIQAEVKLVKCLVDNIVVDISFNQLGGLCTLCFLEEVNYLISQNHLFKRSIILIKAWCYYESRILGAHHGLISTYALETLVLYIFHVFNNCFAGPLEVLYRFLEFFSKFDWDNFCVSLWGPVPISSLPNITADPPRKDGGELLLSKKFLDACTHVYSVFPSGNENHNRPFISKIFNVIDPLRTNNNLGRSVNKGNFYRIRSAFTFGAQRLARLLDCPEDDIEPELSQFFMNAWDRHGKGPRPDIPIPDTSHVQCEDSKKNIRKTSNAESSTSNHSEDEPMRVLHSSHNVCSQNGSFPARQTTRTINASNLSRKSNQKVDNDFLSSMPPEQDPMTAQRINVTSKSQNDRRTNLRAKTHQNEVHSVHQFARTYSSPELTNRSSEVRSQGMSCEAAERRQDKPNSRSGNSGRTWGSRTLQNCSRKSSIDGPSLWHNSSQRRLENDDESNQSSDCYVDESVSEGGNDISSGPQMLDMHQGEQVFVEVTPGIENVGDVQMHMNLASHLPIPMPHSVLGYASQNSGGRIPSSSLSFESHWQSHIHYPHSLIALPMSQYFTDTRAAADQEKLIPRSHGDTLLAELSQVDDDHGSWTEFDADCLRERGPQTESLQTKENERMQQYSSVGFVPSDEALNSCHYELECQHRLTKETESVERKYCDGPMYRQSDAVSCSSSRLSAASVANCSSTQATSECSWYGSPPKIRNSANDVSGRKAASLMSSVTVDDYGWANEGELVDHVSYEADDEDKDWILSSTGETVPPSAASSNVEAPQFSGSSHLSYSKILLPFPPMPVRPGMRQGVSHNHTVLPIAFYPAGLPVPFLTMLPVYNLPTETGTSGASTGHLEVGKGITNFPASQSSHSSDSFKKVDHSCNSNESDLVNGTSVEHAEEGKSDIFNGNFASHWQNLQYGRHCQNSRSQVPFIYSPTVSMPPVQLQGYFQFDHHGRPLPANANPSSQLVSFDHGPTSTSPLQPTSSGPPGGYQQYGRELPQHRTGTGTYFPDPKNFVDRESSSPRLRRGNYSYDRREHHGGREANWSVNSKPRFASRGQVRYQSDKPGARMYRSVSRGYQTERHWDKFRQNSNDYHLSNGPSTSSKFTQYVPDNVDYAMYPMPCVNSNEVSTSRDAVQSVFMLYPYDQTMHCVSSAEQLKFGSVRTLHPSGIDEVPEPNEYLDGAQEPSNCRGNSAKSSPDQPSSPSFQGRFHHQP
ncbi:hypothetical protein Ancab_009894 [Ancistrocladus abbreviatus]